MARLRLSRLALVLGLAFTVLETEVCVGGAGLFGAGSRDLEVMNTTVNQALYSFTVSERDYFINL